MSSLLAKPAKGNNNEEKQTDATKTLMLKTLRQHPEKLHILLLSSYCGNWKAYFRHLGTRFSKIVSLAATEPWTHLPLFRTWGCYK
jgi:hypothetical protein